MLYARFALIRQRLTRARVLLLGSGTMNDFYNTEYLSERVAALAKERDELRKIVRKQHEIIEKIVSEARVRGFELEADEDG